MNVGRSDYVILATQYKMEVFKSKLARTPPHNLSTLLIDKAMYHDGSRLQLDAVIKVRTRTLSNTKCHVLEESTLIMSSREKFIKQ